MRVLITRPEPDAQTLAKLLIERGIEPILAPLISIRIRNDIDVSLADVQAVLFTSANGVRAFAATGAERNLPAFCVGDATAEAAREAGFADISSAAGDVGALASLVAGACDPSGGDLLHAAGSAVAGDLAGALETDGFTVCRAVLYDAEPAAELPDDANAAIERGEIDAVLLFSPRTAARLIDLIRAAGLESACAGIQAVCLSSAVAGALGDLKFAERLVAERPDQASLLALLESVESNGG